MSGGKNTSAINVQCEPLIGSLSVLIHYHQDQRRPKKVRTVQHPYLSNYKKKQLITGFVSPKPSMVSLPLSSLVKIEQQPQYEEEIPKGSIREEFEECSISIGKLSDLEEKGLLDNVVRAGVIPYSIDNGIIHYCIGVDWNSGDYTDFGGGFSKKRDKIPQIAALRELKEESLGVFMFHPSYISNAQCILNDKMLIVFAYVTPNIIDSSIERFETRVTNYINTHVAPPEIRNIEWMTIETLQESIESGKVYEPVANLLKGNVDKLELESNNIAFKRRQRYKPRNNSHVT